MVCAATPAVRCCSSTTGSASHWGMGGHYLAASAADPRGKQQSADQQYRNNTHASLETKNLPDQQTLLVVNIAQFQHALPCMYCTRVRVCNTIKYTLIVMQQQYNSSVDITL